MHTSHPAEAHSRSLVLSALMTCASDANSILSTTSVDGGGNSGYLFLSFHLGHANGIQRGLGQMSAREVWRFLRIGHRTERCSPSACSEKTIKNEYFVLPASLAGSSMLNISQAWIFFPWHILRAHRPANKNALHQDPPDDPSFSQWSSPLAYLVMACRVMPVWLWCI